MIRGLATIVTAAAVTLAPAQLREAVASDAAIAIGPVFVHRFVPASNRLDPRASRAHARSRLAIYGWSHHQFACLDALWTHESNWRTAAYNKTAVTTPTGPKHAGGIPQILGLNPKTPTREQIRLGLNYIHTRFGSPCNAWAHWQIKHSY